MEINKIYNGDCYQLIKEIEDNSIDLIITDPPYQIPGAHASGIIKKGYENRIQKEMVESNIVNGFDLSLLDELCRIMKKVNIYIWCNKEQIYDYLTYFVKAKKCNWELLVWAKNDPTPFCSTHYLKDKEYCLYFWETGVKLNMSYKTGKTVFLTNKNTKDRKKYGHPTIKPLDIIKTLIKNSSEAGGGYL